MGIFDWFKKKGNSSPVAPLQPLSDPMTKADLRLVSFSLQVRRQMVFNMYSGIDGSLMRDGSGWLPKVGISALAHIPGMFQEIVRLLPDEVLYYDVDHRASNINDPLVHELTLEGETVDKENPSTTTRRKQVIRWELGPNSKESHPILDALIHAAAIFVGVSNIWYFDIVTLWCLDLRSNLWPQGIVTGPNPETTSTEEIWWQMVMQVYHSPNRQQLFQYPQGTIYTKTSTGKQYTIRLFMENGKVARSIDPVG